MTERLYFALLWDQERLFEQFSLKPENLFRKLNRDGRDPLVATSEWRWILMFAHGFNGRETESWINYKRSMESVGKTQEGSTWFQNWKKAPKGKFLPAESTSGDSQDGHPVGLHSTHWCWSSQPEQFWPPEDIKQCLQTFFTVTLVGGVLLASSG